MSEGMTVWHPKDIQNSALDDYSNFIKWTEYIVPAPMVIALLGELAVLSNQYQDFGLETPEGGTFKLIKYPESFKTTLMQICDESYYTFESAHHNMDKLRQQTARVPRLLSDIVTLLVTGDDEDVHDYLPILLKGIKKIAQDSKSLSHETAEKFDQTASLIDEVTLASKSSQGKSETDLHDSQLNATIAKQQAEELKERKEQESEALKAAKQRSKDAEDQYQTALDNVPSGWELLGMKLTETVVSLVSDGAKMAMQQQFGGGQELHEDEQKNNEPSSKASQIKDNSDLNLLERLSSVSLSAIKDFSNDLFVKSKQLGLSLKCEALSNVETVENLMDSLEKEKQEDDDLDQDIATKLDDAMTSLRSSFTNAQRHCQQNRTDNADALSTEFHKDESILQRAINTMNVFMKKSNIPLPSSSQTQGGSDNPDIADQTLKNSQEAVTSAKEMLKFQEEQERKEREAYNKAADEFRKVQGEIIALNAKVASLKEILELLKKALFVLSKLSAQWRKMADFFKMMDTMVDTWEKGPQAQFIGIVEKGLSNIEEKHKQMSTFAKQTMFGYARESASYAFVINRVSTGYFKISSGYLLIPMASLKELMALDAKDEKLLMSKKTQLKQQADSAIAKIKEFGKNEAERTTDSLKAKMKAIDEEFNDILSKQTPGEKQAIIQKTREDMKKMKTPEPIVQGNMEQYSKIDDDDFLNNI